MADDIDITKITEFANSGKLAEMIDGLKNLKGNLPEVSSKLEEVAKNTSLTGEEFHKFITKAVHGLGITGASADSLVGKLKKIGEMAKEAFSHVDIVESYNTVMGKLKTTISDLADRYGGLAAEGGLMLGLIYRTDQSTLFKKLGESAKDAAGDINEATKSVLKLSGYENTSFGKYTQELATRADSARDMENSILTQAAAMGKLNEVYGEAGSGLAGLSDRTEEYAKFSSTIGSAVGMVPNQMADAMVKASKVPGMLDEVSKTGMIAGQQIHEFQAALEVATGSGQSYTVVLEDLRNTKDRFAISTEKALEIVARTGDVAQATGVKLEYVRKYVDAATNSFGMLGNNAQSAIDIFNDMAPALKDLGAGPEQIQKIMEGAAKGISEMTTAQKGFLSASTGGPGGLKGAFEIDYQISQGKASDVFQKVKDNLQKQIGAPMVTLEQARGSDAAAAQMQKQISMIKSSSLGGMAKTDDAAIKLLDAMARQQDLGKVAKKLISPQKSLEDTMKKGATIQDRNNNVMIDLSNKIAYMSATQDRLAKEMMRGWSKTAEFKPDRVAAKGLYKDSPMTGTGASAGKGREEQAIHAVVGVAKPTYEAMKGVFGSAKSKIDELKDSKKTNKGVEVETPEKPRERVASRATVAEAIVPSEPRAATAMLPSRRVEKDISGTKQVMEGKSASTLNGVGSTSEHEKHIQQHIIHVTCASCNKKQSELIVGEKLRENNELQSRAASRGAHGISQ